MNKLLLMTKQIEQIFFEDSERFVVKTVGDWVNEYKNQSTCDFTFEDTKTGLIYGAYVSKDDSYYSEYYWGSEFDNCTETLYPVEEVEVIIKRTQAIKDGRITGEEDLTEEGDI